MNGKKHKKVLGALALTPTRVILYHNKMSFMGHFSMDYPIKRINNVVFNVGIFWAEIRIHSGDDVLLIERLPIADETEDFVKNLKTMIYEANNKGSNIQNFQGSQAPFIDIADQLQKLADLKTQGILTEKEFAAQKKKLLGS
jgi:Short C-terminal domain